MPVIVEQISIQKLLQYAAMPPTPVDALAMVELGRDVDRNGVKDPVIIWVNIVERTIRLDSGNHRVYMMPLMGWTHLPAICRISNKSIGDPANGSHFYYSSKIKIPPLFRVEYDERPSLVIDGIL